MKLGILGAGGIASTMAKTVAEMKGVEVYAVAARDLERARVFAQKYEVKKAYGSYEEMLADDEVELVYIATPHSHHYLHAKMCLEAGKHVLCEKAFTVNAEQAQKLFDLAKEKKLLITEAIWTRYMPSRKMINDIIESGVIGEVTAVTANLSYTVSHVERILSLIHIFKETSGEPENDRAGSGMYPDPGYQEVCGVRTGAEDEESCHEKTSLQRTAFCDSEKCFYAR